MLHVKRQDSIRQSISIMNITIEWWKQSSQTITTNKQQETIMINVKQLVYKALSGDERAYRNLVRRYGKVTTAELLKAGSKTCRQ